MKKKYLTLAAVATMLAACSSNDEIVTQEENLKDTPITIASAGVAELTTARAFDGTTLVGTGASIGLYVENENSNYAATHERYDYSESESESDSKWKFSANDKDDTQMLYSGTGSFAYIAYSPYSIIKKDESTDTYLYNMTEFTVPTDGDYNGGRTEGTYADVTTVSGSQYDLLWGTASSSSATITPALNHVLTMICVNITGMGTELDSELDIKDVTINNSKVTGDLKLTGIDPASNVITVKEGATATGIKAVLFTGGSGDYEALIIPQTVALQIKVTLSNDQVFVSNLSELVFQPATKYTINVKVGQDKVEAGTISAAAWGTAQDGGSLETE